MDLAERYDLRVPRYTSYPTAPHFTPAVSGEAYRGWLGDLAPTDFAVLGSLAAACGPVLSRYELVNRVRGYEFDGYERTIDSHVKNLRRKVERDPHEPRIVQTVVGVGYRLGLLRDR